MKNKKMTRGGAAGISIQQFKKNSLLYFIVILLCAAMLGCAFIMPKIAEAESVITPESVQIGELTLSGYDSSASDGKVFNGAELRNLYSAILGKDGASYDDLKERLYDNGKPKTEIYEGFDIETVDQNIEVPCGITSEDLRGENYGGSEIAVTFGGIEWEVVYITTASGDRNGHIIIDLWQKSSTLKSKFSGGTGCSQPQDTESENPSHLYSTSYIRSNALNAGSDYYLFESKNMTGNNGLIDDNGQSEHNQYAKFTMANGLLSETENAGKSLIKYIAKPSEIKYQEIESWLDVVGQTVAGGESYCMPNEAYGTPWKEYYYSGVGSVNTGYGGNGVNIKVGYGDWADDYLWLPSISEIYKDKNSGIWGLSDEQRATEENVWLRTGNHSNAGEVITLNSYGIINSQTCNEYLVRPALHLDLTEAEQAAQLPEPEVEVVFDIKSTLYTCDGLPQPTSCTANYGGANVEGKFVWDEQPIVSGTNIYKWTFVPADKGFCEVHGEQELHFEALTVVGIQASLNTGSKIYACTTEDEFRSCVTVIVNYVNGKTVETEEYKIENFALTVGVVNKLIITYSSPDGSFSAELAVEEVEEVEATDIIVEFDGADGYELYPDSDINCLKPYIAVKVKWNFKEDYETVKAEDYTLKANGKLEVGEADIFVGYAGLEKLIEPKPTVNKGTYDMSGIKLVGEYEVVYDGAPHGLEVVGNLPDGVVLDSLKYISESGETSIKPVNAGAYTVIAAFKGDFHNFNVIEDITANLTILKKVYSLPQIDSREYTGENIDFTPQFVAENLGSVKLSVNGVEDANGFIKKTVGSYTVTVEIISNNIIFEGETKKAELKFGITKKILDLPEYIGNLYFTGNKILPTAQDFKNFNSALMVISDKSQYGKDAGSYIAVISLTDEHNYAWRTDAAAVHSEDNISQSEIQILWSVERAVISATRTADKMPFIVSESYRGSFDNVVGYRYYADAECTQGVLLADLKEGEKYFVCADLIDTDNFVLDEAAEKIFNVPFSYTARTDNSDLLIAAEKLSETNKAILAVGACILGFGVLLVISVVAAVGFIFFKKRKLLGIGEISTLPVTPPIYGNVAETQPTVPTSEVNQIKSAHNEDTVSKADAEDKKKISSKRKQKNK